MRLEIVWAIAQRDAPPVIGTTAQHARPPPIEAACILFAGTHIGFTRHLPAAIHRRVVEAKWLVRRTGSPKRRHIRRAEHGRLGFGGVFAAGFEHQDFRTVHAEGISRLATGGAGGDPDDVVEALLVFGRYE